MIDWPLIACVIATLGCFAFIFVLGVKAIAEHREADPLPKTDHKPCPWTLREADRAVRLGDQHPVFKPSHSSLDN